MWMDDGWNSLNINFPFVGARDTWDTLDYYIGVYWGKLGRIHTHILIVDTLGGIHWDTLGYIEALRYIWIYWNTLGWVYWGKLGFIEMHWGRHIGHIESVYIEAHWRSMGHIGAHWLAIENFFIGTNWNTLIGIVLWTLIISHENWKKNLLKAVKKACGKKCKHDKSYEKSWKALKGVNQMLWKWY